MQAFRGCLPWTCSFGAAEQQKWFLMFLAQNDKNSNNRVTCSEMEAGLTKLGCNNVAAAVSKIFQVLLI